jgi:hypothetical protein
VEEIDGAGRPVRTLGEFESCPPAKDGMEESDVRPFLGERVGLFVGGSTAWKLATLAQWARLGREVGCWVHVGRVNSSRRIAACAGVGATSFDGTSVSRFAKTLRPLDAARRQLSLGVG